MKNERRILRYLLAGVGVFAVTLPFYSSWGLLIGEALLSWLPAIVVTVLMVVIPLLVVIGGVRLLMQRNASLEHLAGFTVAVYVLTMLLAGLTILLQPLFTAQTQNSYLFFVGQSLATVTMAYIISYLLVYQGWYGRVKRGIVS